MEIPIEYDPDFGKITDESDLDDSWKELARANVNDVPELRSERIAELRRLLEESGTVLHPGDDRQMLMFLRSARCEPGEASNVVRHFLEYRQYIAKPLPSELRDLMEATKHLYCVLPHRDKVGWAGPFNYRVILVATDYLLSALNYKITLAPWLGPHLGRNTTS